MRIFLCCWLACVHALFAVAESLHALCAMCGWTVDVSFSVAAGWRQVCFWKPKLPARQEGGGCEASAKGGLKAPDISLSIVLLVRLILFRTSQLLVRSESPSWVVLGLSALLLRLEVDVPPVLTHDIFVVVVVVLCKFYGIHLSVIYYLIILAVRFCNSLRISAEIGNRKYRVIVYCSSTI